TLAGQLALVAVREPLADRRQSPGPAWPEREPARPRCPCRRPAERLVRVDRVPADAVVVDDGAGDERELGGADAVVALREQLSREAGRCFHAVQRAAGQADAVGPEVFAADEAHSAASNVDLEGGALREDEDGTAGRPLVVLGDADLEVREIE